MKIAKRDGGLKCVYFGTHFNFTSVWGTEKVKGEGGGLL